MGNQKSAIRNVKTRNSQTNFHHSTTPWASNIAHPHQPATRNP